jgi:hypothetical protein
VFGVQKNRLAATVAVLIAVVVVAAILSAGGYASPVLTLQTDDATIKFSRLGYEALFTPGNLHDIEIVMSKAEWVGMLRDMREYAASDPAGRPLSGNYRRATFIYRGPAGDAVIEEVGFRPKGHFSRPYPQDLYGYGDFNRAHFKIKFNLAFDEVEGTPEYEDRNQRRFAKLRELELRMPIHNADTGAWDASQIRELYAYDLMRQAGTNTSRTGAARVTITIDGEPHYFGIYTLIEPIDKSFLTKRYGSGANDGNLYKCLWGDSGPANLGPIDDPSNFKHLLARDPRIIGVKDWRSHYRPTYDLKTNTEFPDHTVLLDFVRNLDELDGAALKEYLGATFEVDRFIRYLAMNFLVGKWDDYWAIGNNYYLYFNNDGKIELYSVDYDMAFGDGFALFDTANVGIYDWGNRNLDLLRVIAPNLPPEVAESASFHYPLAEKILDIPEYREAYESYLKEFITPANRLFLFSEFERAYNQAYAAYAPYLDNDTDEGEEMYISDVVRDYYRDKTLSVIEQLGLDRTDFEIPAPSVSAGKVQTRQSSDDARTEVPATGDASGWTEVVNHSARFSLHHPANWQDTTNTQPYEAVAPSQTSGVFVSLWVTPAESEFPAAIQRTLTEGPVEILASGAVTLDDGTEAETAEFTATIVGYPMHIYSVGVRQGIMWLVVNVWNIDQYGEFDGDLFERIAHSLRIN